MWYDTSMIIHLTGADTYRSHQRLRQLRQAFIAKHDPSGLNTVSLDGGAASTEDIRAAVTTTGFFAAKRFVAIDHYDQKRSACPPEQLLTAVRLAAGHDDVVVVVRDEPPESSPTRRSRSRAKRPTGGAMDIPSAKVEQFNRLTGPELVRWIIGQAKSRGGRLSPALAERLAALGAGDTWRIANELDKLILHASGRPITDDDLEALVVSSAASDIFALTDAIGARQRATALRLVHQELAAGTHPLALILVLANHIRTLYAVRRAFDQAGGQSTTAQRLGLHPYVFQKAVRQAQFFTPDDLRLWHHRLADIDLDLKSTTLDAETLINLLIVK